MAYFNQKNASLFNQAEAERNEMQTWMVTPYKDAEK
jgi:hypothetical protein